MSDLPLISALALLLIQIITVNQIKITIKSKKFLVAYSARFMSFVPLAISH